MIRVAAIVEGYGDVKAVPSLIAKAGMLFGVHAIASDPIRAGEWPFLRRPGVLEKYLELAARRNWDKIVVVMDMDDDCPVEESLNAASRIDDWRGNRNLAVDVVFANREYETMFLFSPQCLGEFIEENVPDDPESIRGAKERVKLLIGRRYKEPQDQLRFTQALDGEQLFEKSRTFRKLCKSITGNGYDVMESVLGKIPVT